MRVRGGEVRPFCLIPRKVACVLQHIMQLGLLRGGDRKWIHCFRLASFWAFFPCPGCCFKAPVSICWFDSILNYPPHASTQACLRLLTDGSHSTNHLALITYKKHPPRASCCA